MYKKIIKKENEIFELFNIEINNKDLKENKSKKILIKIFFRHALNQINRQSYIKNNNLELNSISNTKEINDKILDKVLSLF